MATRLIDFLAGFGAAITVVALIYWQYLGEFMAWLRFTM